jgi:hypothetical protein
VVKFEADWEGAKGVLMEAAGEKTEAETKERYRYFWIVVNSRCFYWEYAKVVNKAGGVVGPWRKKRRVQDPNECMALCPVADYFNHADEGVCC